MTKISQETLSQLGARCCFKDRLFEQRSSASSRYQQATYELREEIFSCLGHKTWTQAKSSCLIWTVFEFHWEIDQIELNSAFRHGFIMHFLSTIDNLAMRISAVNPILLDGEEDKANSPPKAKTPVSERPTRPPALLRRCPFRTRIKKFLTMFLKNCLI